MSYTFKAYRAIEDEESCLAFHEGHSKILLELGINNLTSNEPSWMQDADVLVINVIDNDNNEVVGGIRVHKYNLNFSLPIIDALIDLDDNIVNTFELIREQGVVESCGLWNSKKVYGKGISPLLARASVSLSATFRPKHLYCFSAPYTLRMIMKLGFLPALELGNMGKFHYPSEKFISSVLRIEDLYVLHSADSFEKERIFSLMTEPNQHYIENSQGKEVDVYYNLIESIDVQSHRHE